MIAARKTKRLFAFRVPDGADLYESLTVFCAKRGVRCGWITVLGATTEACFGYYDQKTHEYHKKVFREPMEILSCVGNASIKDGKVFLHLHATFGDEKLKAWGGHVFLGTKVFSAEAYVRELSGPPLKRSLGKETGLSSWPSCPL